jgi:putative flippase GtrA
MIYEQLSRLVRFAAVGGLSTVVYSGVYAALAETIKPSVLLTTIVAYGCAMVASFLGHKHVTFRAKGNTARQAVRYIFVYSAGLALAYLIMDVTMNVYHLQYWIGILIVDVALPFVSLFFMLVFIFADRSSAKPAGETSQLHAAAEQ